MFIKDYPKFDRINSGFDYFQNFKGFQETSSLDKIFSDFLQDF